MRSLEPHLRNLAENDVECDASFKAKLREDLQLAARSHQIASGLRWRSFSLLSLAGVLILFLLRPGIAVRSHEWVFGRDVPAPVTMSQPANSPFSQWINQAQVNPQQTVSYAGQPMSAAIQQVVSETHFVMRQVMLESGEMVMVLSEIPAQPSTYKIY